MKRKEEIEHALSVLGRRMALDGAPDMEVLCCGASALCVLGLLSRSTMDVDVLGVVVRDQDLDPCEVFPVEMERAIAMQDWNSDSRTIGSTEALHACSSVECRRERSRGLSCIGGRSGLVSGSASWTAGIRLH